MKYKGIRGDTEKPLKVTKGTIYRIQSHGFDFERGDYRDMLRYDACFIHKPGLDAILKAIADNPKERMSKHFAFVLFLHQRGWNPTPEIARWHSFGFVIEKVAEATPFKIAENVAEWVGMRHPQKPNFGGTDYGAWEQVLLKDLVVLEGAENFASVKVEPTPTKTAHVRVGNRDVPVKVADNYKGD